MASCASRIDKVTLPGGAAGEAVVLTAPGQSAALAPAVGGELASWRVEWRGRPVELLYRGLDYGPSPSSWTGRAPLLWPQPGRCRLKGEKAPVQPDGKEIGAWRVDGRRFAMPGHGFVRNQAWRLEGHGSDASAAWATAAITDNEISRRYYPFAFRLACTCRLDAEAVRLIYEITNRSADGVMPFGLGNHITLNMPVTAGGRYEDCVVTSPTDRQMEVAPDAFLTGRTIDKDLRRGRAMADATLADTMFGCYETDAPWVEVRDPASFAVRVTQQARGVALPRSAFRYVFWAEAEQRYFCPEPWIGEPDTLNSRQAAVELPPGETFIWELTFQRRL